MGYRLNRLDEPVFMTGQKSMPTEFGIHQWLESCAHEWCLSKCLSRFFALLICTCGVSLSLCNPPKSKLVTTPLHKPSGPGIPDPNWRQRLGLPWWPEPRPRSSTRTQESAASTWTPPPLTGIYPVGSCWDKVIWSPLLGHTKMLKCLKWETELQFDCQTAMQYQWTWVKDFRGFKTLTT